MHLEGDASDADESILYDDPGETVAPGGQKLVEIIGTDTGTAGPVAPTEPPADDK